MRNLLRTLAQPTHRRFGALRVDLDDLRVDLDAKPSRVAIATRRPRLALDLARYRFDRGPAGPIN